MGETRHGPQPSLNLGYLGEKGQKYHLCWITEIRYVVVFEMTSNGYFLLTLRALAEAQGCSSEALSLGHVPVTLGTVGLLSFGRGVRVFSPIRTTPSNMSLSGNQTASSRIMTFNKDRLYLTLPTANVSSFTSANYLNKSRTGSCESNS